MSSLLVRARRTTVGRSPAPLDSPLDVPATSVRDRFEDDMSVLLWQVKGESLFEVEGVDIALAAGSALWIPTRSRHSFTMQPNSSVLPMFFPDAEPGSGLSHPTIVVIEDHVETACLALVGSYYSLVDPPADLTNIVRSLIVAQTAVPDGVRMPTSLPALRIARGLLLSPGDRRTLADWARVVHLSTRSLERAFRSETGLTWRQWRQACRMARATHMLVDGNASVTTIAHRVGFDTHSSFTRSFREFHGVSPTEYRDGVRPLRAVDTVRRPSAVRPASSVPHSARRVIGA